MNMQLIMQVARKFIKRVPVIRTGNTVRIHQKIKEAGKERIQIFEGLVIAINSGYATDKTITVRKMVGGIGVEKIFLLYSPNIAEIQVIKESKIRRAKLYHMRKRSGKSARLKETHLSEKDVVMEDILPEEVAAVVEEVVEAVETPVEAQTDAPVVEAVAAEQPEVVAEEAPVVVEEDKSSSEEVKTEEV
ncbi:50S ribosomal protein L19 [Patescibacteria group bacterium]|nr:50S ribosomal protein L19 [Patescibacteria group bacterium]